MGVHLSMHTRSWCTWWYTVVTALLALISLTDDLHVRALIAEEALSESPMTLAPRTTAYFNMTDEPVVITINLQEVSHTHEWRRTNLNYAAALERIHFDARSVPVDSSTMMPGDL